jgi:predicted protein tyrosine phosphatase
MKIFVCSKKEMRSQYYTDKNWYNDPNKYFISIAGLADGCEYPCPFLCKDSKRVLHLLFDDVTERERDNPSLRLFDQDHANKILEFIKTIPNAEDTVIYVNCAAGISRSGAVGYCLNVYFNMENEKEFLFFREMNKQIQPNPMIKRILMNTLTDDKYGKKTYAEIFGLNEKRN